MRSTPIIFVHYCYSYRLRGQVEMLYMCTCTYNTNCLYSPCSIIGQLERLKREAADVQKKVEETDVVMAEVETVSQQYLPLSAACSSMYFTLESLNQVTILAG